MYQCLNTQAEITVASCLHKCTYSTSELEREDHVSIYKLSDFTGIMK